MGEGQGEKITEIGKKTKKDGRLEGREAERSNKNESAGFADTHAFHWTESGTGFPLAWQVSSTFVRPRYQLLS